MRTMRLLRRRDAARVLSVSESQIEKWEKAGVLRRIDVPGIRAVRYLDEEVEAVAKSIIEHGTLTPLAP